MPQAKENVSLQIVTQDFKEQVRMKGQKINTPKNPSGFQQDPIKSRTKIKPKFNPMLNFRTLKISEGIK